MWRGHQKNLEKRKSDKNKDVQSYGASRYFFIFIFIYKGQVDLTIRKLENQRCGGATKKT